MKGAQVHWQAGQGDREMRGGEEELGLGQRDPEGEARGRVDKERGETGREEEASRVTKDSLLGEAGMMMGSGWLGPIEEGGRLRSVGVVAVSEGGAGFGVGVVSVGEVETEVGEVGTEEAEEGTVGGELAVGEGGKGEVMRGIGEDGWGEKGKAGD